MKVDINDLGEASYNELIRLKFIDDKPRNELTSLEIEKINAKIYERIGDNLLNQIFKYDNGKLSHIEYRFNEIGVLTEFILIFALAYVNNMDLNQYFGLNIKD